MVERARRTCGNTKRASGHATASGRAEAGKSRRQTRAKARSARAESERRVIDARERGGKINIFVTLAQSLRLVYRSRDAAFDLQRRNGHEQERRSRRARLADHVRLQHVFVSGLEMDRRRSVRTHAPADRLDRRIPNRYARNLALAR